MLLRKGTRAALLVFVFVLILVLVAAASCREKRVELPDPVYREVVSAFYTGLAALETSQDVLARDKLQRVSELAPMEPAAWADLGVLEMRRGDFEAASRSLARASELAPQSAAVERLLAVSANQQGKLDLSITHWKRAIELDPENVEAPFALARETERLGGPGDEDEAERVLQSLLARSDNLAVRLELARLAAKRGDRETLEAAVAPLFSMSSSWPREAKEQLEALVASMAQGPSAAAPHAIFLRNVLLRDPAFRRDLTEVTRGDTLLGEPLVRFLALENPEPTPAPADDALSFTLEPPESLGTAQASWVGAVSLNGEGPPVAAVVGGGELRLADANRTRVPFPGVSGWEGVLSADLDNDFRTDLVLAGSRGLSVLRQTGQGGFTDVTSSSGLSAERVRQPAFGVWAADVDTDGDLDVVLAPVDSPPLVLRNNGDGTFAERHPFGKVSRLRGFVWADLDGDGVPDAATLDAEGAVRVFLNLRGGELRELPAASNVASAVALATAEASGDSILDLLVLTGDGSVLRFWWNDVERRFETAPIERGGGVPGMARLLTADLDNNGAIDLVVAGETASRVFLGASGGTFAPIADVDLSARAAADLDGDGRLELLGVGREHRAMVATGRGTRSYHWQVFHPRATSASGDQRISSFGLGGEVEVRTGLNVQKRPIDSPLVHFGLGDAERAEVARIGWPNGVLQSEFDLEADTTILASQRLKGSCPWLFTWNGSEMTFVTDLLWRSPLGLRINAQQTADVLMTGDAVKVRADQLMPRDGYYDLRVTSELWETQFFDLLSLLVVDHPPGTEIFVDERFAVPPPNLEVHVTGPVEAMAGVRDDTGQDVSEIVRTRDGRYLDSAGRGVYQGVTRDHFVEMELPDSAPRNQPLWLVGQGWVHPTDSSINVALSQGSHPAPRGISLLVDEGGGRFRLVRDDLGFPAGKTKTVLLDLTGVFPSRGPRRLRLETNLEVYWDRLGWAVARPDIVPETRRIEPAMAELRYRGYSVAEQKDASSPELPRYTLAGTAPRWRDLEGYHTRFGDVRELLLSVDDRYVMMNAGDEIRLRFPEAPPPAAGRLRDFVVRSDGWVKDGDFNTTFSRTVLPLPTHSRSRYDDPPGALEDDPVYRMHRRDFETYHTRYVSPESLRDALRCDRPFHRDP